MAAADWRGMAGKLLVVAAVFVSVSCRPTTSPRVRPALKANRGRIPPVDPLSGFAGPASLVVPKLTKASASNLQFSAALEFAAVWRTTLPPLVFSSTPASLQLLVLGLWCSVADSWAPVGAVLSADRDQLSRQRPAAPRCASRPTGQRPQVGPALQCCAELDRISKNKI